jgi:uncharacterized membrane protein
MPAPKLVTVQRPLGRALARRRRASLSLLQLTYIGAAAVLGALLRIVYSLSFSLEDGAAASALVPLTATLLVLVAVGLFRILLTTAFSSIQLGATLHTVAGRGIEVIEGVYPQPFDPTAPSTGPAGPLPPTRTEVYWPHPGATLQRIDVARLIQAAARTDCVVEFRVGVGQVVRQGRGTRVPCGADTPRMPAWTAYST